MKRIVILLVVIVIAIILVVVWKKTYANSTSEVFAYKTNIGSKKTV